MCGIFAYVGNRQDSQKMILEGLKTLEYRGYDSWGIAVGKGEKIAVEKKVGKIGDAETTLPNSNIGIGHTRWATHGGVTQLNAHPHLNADETIAVVHNGIVENYQELKAQLIAEGNTFVSETDTEVIAHLIEKNMRDLDFKSALCKTFSMLAGSNAICVLNLKTSEIGVCRDGSPIIVGIGKDEYFIGSDVTAFLQYTKDVVFLDDGQGAIISAKGCEVFNIASKKTLHVVPTTIDWEAEEAQKGGYSHYMLKEIMEQLVTIPKTAKINDDELIAAADLVKNAQKVIITACGSAGFCALITKYMLAQHGVASEMCGAYESASTIEFADKRTVLITISQSGETADTLIAVKKAKKKGAKIISAINARGSTLERISDVALMVGSGPEIAVVSTKAFTAQLATMYRLAGLCGDKPKDLRQEIVEAGGKLKSWLTKETVDDITQLAANLLTNEHIYFLGKDLQYPAAMECSLKVKETSYIHGEAFSSGELKHGVIALIDKGTPCIVLGAHDGYESEVRASAAEVKARGGRIIGIAPFEASEFDTTIITPDLGPLTILGNIIVGQLLGYYCAIGRGADPDKPRNLAKSVTVK